MADKQQPKGKSSPQGFTHGLVSDADPRFQLKGSYSDAQNIRLTNSEGDTFTVENIEGNSVFIDLFALQNQNTNQSQGILGTSFSSPPLGANAPVSEIFYDPTSHTWGGAEVGAQYPWYQTSWNSGRKNRLGSYPFFDFSHPGGAGKGRYTYQPDALSLEGRSSIVGYTSYGNELILIIVARYEYELHDIDLSNTDTTITHDSSGVNRTIFLKIIFDDNLKVESVYDMRVCVDSEYPYKNYPDLGMDIDNPVRVEHIVENECLSRIYWTDNKNPLRTLNINQSGKNKLHKDSLDITPLMSPSQPTLKSTVHGSLPVGIYQYTYKYISANGGETTFSPLSNLYHVSNQAFGSSNTYGGGPPGELGTQGFRIDVYDVDKDFDYIELYALMYEEFNTPPKVAVVNRQSIKGYTGSGPVNFTHSAWNNQIDGGLEEVLIEQNTWDICKDIAIKDNILFAANLKQKRNWISEKEWNVKILRYRINDVSEWASILTTDDLNVKHYWSDGTVVAVSDGDEIDQGYGDQEAKHGFLIGTSHVSVCNYDGTKDTPSWTKHLESQREGVPNSAVGGGNTSGSRQKNYEYRYLCDRMTLGGESYDYSDNELGGCRVTFGISEKVSDQTQNTSTSPYISATSESESIKMDGYRSTGVSSTHVSTNTNTTFNSSMSIGGSKDPHNAGNKRGYQRGEVYRFGVQVYDLSGTPGNVLWIGDIQMPEMYDPLRMLNPNETEYSPSDRTKLLNDNEIFCSHVYAQDHRLSYIYGHVIPAIDVEWFSGRMTNSLKNLEAYVTKNGAQQGDLPNDLDNSRTPEKRRKALTNGFTRGDPGIADPMDMDVGWAAFNHTHYLFDLYVNFEFIIPDDVCKKISGFRVVRAERKEEDRRIVQQGLLNQTVQYGDATEDLQYGYDGTNFSAADNKAFDDDPVFTNAESTSSTPTEVEQPEYNTYLNGYLGLAENSYSAWYDDSISDGKVSPGGNLGDTVFYWPEHENAKPNDSTLQSYSIPNHTTVPGLYGPGHFAKHNRHSAYFGGLDKTLLIHDGASAGDINKGDLKNSGNLRERLEVSGSIYTLDSPDSAFGQRPYVFKDGDMLRIDCVLKLSDKERYTKYLNGNDPSGYYDHLAGAKSEDFNGDLIWAPLNKDSTEHESLRYASKRKIDDDYGVLIGKYYCWDPSYGITMEMGAGGGIIGQQYTGNNQGGSPSSHGYILPISAAKELGSGEIVPAGFFKKSRRLKKGYVHGFSNNTLGFVKHRHAGTSSDRACYCFGSIKKTISKYDAGSNGANISGWTSSKQKKDVKYDTVSTLQMGLRSLLIELNTNVSEVRKKGPLDDDTYFKPSTGNVSSSWWLATHNAWFSPYNISAFYTSGRWIGRSNISGSADQNEWLNIPQYSSVLSTDLGTLSINNGNATDLHKSYNPHKYLCSVVRRVVPYGGWTKSSIQSTRYIVCGNFHPITANGTKQGHLSTVYGGDTFVNFYSHQKTSTPYMKKSYARWQIFPVESYVNTDMRSGLTLNNGDTELGKSPKNPPFSNDWLYNSVYSQENSIKSSLMIDEEKSCESQNLPFEIAYSNTKLSGEQGDAFRSFPIHQFHDMEGIYGEINRIINFKNEIYVLQDRGFAKLLVNPLSMLKDEAGTALFTGTGDTVENHIYISTKYGTRHRFSVATSEQSLYFVDVNYARLFKYDTEKLVSLGDSLGMRNYLRYIIKDWEQKPLKICSSHSYWHPTIKGSLDSVRKLERNYFSDNPLRFLGITSVFDHQNKELLVSFHNSAWGSTGSHREVFIRPEDNHPMGSSTNGQPARLSETLVYNEGVNAFISKFSVVPPMWMSGNQGAFIFTTENEISVKSIYNEGNYKHLPYEVHGSYDNYHYKQLRCNPLRLWIWNKHDDKKKTHFFGKKDNQYTKDIDASYPGPSGIPIYEGTAPDTTQAMEITDAGINDVASESFIEKVVNDDAGESKVFDNVHIPMTPEHVKLSDVQFSTELSKGPESPINRKWRFLSNSLNAGDQEITINKRWNFNDSWDNWQFYPDSSTGIAEAPTINTGSSTITLEHTSNGLFRSPTQGEFLFDGKYNYLIRARIKRTSATNDWEGKLRWSGIGKDGDFNRWGEDSARSKVIVEPTDIDSDFVIVQWDMRGTSEYEDSMIEFIRIDLDDGEADYEVDWIEIGGLTSAKYHSAILRFPLRTEESIRRARGTWLKVKYRAKTTDKFNIFAIMAKYRRTFR